MKDGLIINVFEGFPTFAILLQSASHIFQFVASSDLVAAFIVLGYFFVILSYYRDFLQGKTGSLYIYMASVMMGLMIYTAFIKVQMPIMLKDQSSNSHVTTKLPVGVALFLYTSNILEQTAVGAIETAVLGGATGKNFASISGGKAYDALLHMALNGISYANKNYMEALNEYLNSCVVWNLDEAKEVVENKKDVIEFFRNAGNPAVPAMVYKFSVESKLSNNWLHNFLSNNNLNEWGLSAGTSYRTLNFVEKEEGTCKDAADSLFKPDVLGAVGDEILVNTCKSAGHFGNLDSCVSGLSNLLGFIDSNSLQNLSPIAVRVLTARALNEYALQGNWAGLVNYQTVRQSISTSLVLNQYVPVIKNILIGLVIASLPFLTLFMFSPYFEKVIAYVFGMFLWLTLWGIMDALSQSVVLAIIREQFVSLFSSSSDEALKRFGAYLTMENPAERGLGLIGYIRGTGILLAGLISYAITQFGGYMLASLGNAAISGIINPAASHGAQLYTPAGYKQAISEAEQAGALHALSTIDFATRYSMSVNQALMNAVSTGFMKPIHALSKGFVGLMQNIAPHEMGKLGEELRDIRAISLRGFFDKLGKTIATEFARVRWENKISMEDFKNSLGQISLNIPGLQGTVTISGDGNVNLTGGNISMRGRLNFETGELTVDSFNFPRAISMGDRIYKQYAASKAISEQLSQSSNISVNEAFAKAYGIALGYGLSEQKAIQLAHSLVNQWAQSQNIGLSGGYNVGGSTQTTVGVGAVGSNVGKSSHEGLNVGENYQRNTGLSDVISINQAANLAKTITENLSKNISDNLTEQFQKGMAVAENLSTSSQQSMAEGQDKSINIQYPAITVELFDKFLRERGLGELTFEEMVRLEDEFIKWLQKQDSDEILGVLPNEKKFEGEYKAVEQGIEKEKEKIEAKYEPDTARMKLERENLKYLEKKFENWGLNFSKQEKQEVAKIATALGINFAEVSQKSKKEIKDFLEGINNKFGRKIFIIKGNEVSINYNEAQFAMFSTKSFERNLGTVKDNVEKVLNLLGDSLSRIINRK